MRTAGYLLIAAGFVWGSLVAVQTAENLVSWAGFLPGLGIATLGVLMTRAASSRMALGADLLKTDHRHLREAIERIVLNLGQIEAVRAELDPGDLHTRIDVLLRDDLTRFAEARETIAHLYGLRAYAAIMNEFAAGERYLNRVWSASVDGYADEAWTYLGRAKDQLGAAQRLLGELGQVDGGSGGKR